MNIFMQQETVFFKSHSEETSWPITVEHFSRAAARKFLAEFLNFSFTALYLLSWSLQNFWTRSDCSAFQTFGGIPLKPALEFDIFWKPSDCIGGIFFGCELKRSPEPQSWQCSYCANLFELYLVRCPLFRTKVFKRFPDRSANSPPKIVSHLQCKTNFFFLNILIKISRSSFTS